MKKLLVVACSFLVAVSIMSCTSSDNKDETQSAASSDENMPLDAGGENAAVDGTTPPADGATPPADAQASAGLDDVPLDGNVDASKTAAAPTDGAGSLDLGDPDKEFPADVAKSQKEGVAPTDDKLFADAGAPGTPPPAAGDQAATTAPPDVTATPQDATAAPVDAASSVPAADTVAATDPAAAPVVLPYEKIKTEPFEKKGVLLNRVYIARPKDTAKNISEKIYGTPDKAKDLKAWNPSLKAHAPRVGDKIYYSSPKDPQDNTKMLVYYEEMGVAPMSYTTQPGDDIRKVSTKLLGHKDSWKEIYATNLALENKMGKAPEGVELRYWPSTSDATQTMAQNLPPAGNNGLPPDQMNNVDPNAGANAPPPPQAAAGTMGGPGGNPNVPPPPPAMGNVPPPPPQAAAAPPPPPMEQPAAQVPPPPPPPMAEQRTMKKPASPAANMEASADPDQTMIMLAGGLLIVAAAAAFVVIRRQRAKRIDLSQQTQV